MTTNENNEPNELEPQNDGELESTPVTLADVVEALDKGGDIDALTTLVIKVILDEHQEEAANWLRSPIRNFIRHTRRNAALKAENEAFKTAPAQGQDMPAKSPQAPAQQPAGPAQDQAPGHGHQAPAEPVTYEPDPLEPYRELAGVPFWVPGGQSTTWGEATEADHQARAQWLRGKAGALVVTAERHEGAAKLIHDAGVERLADIAGF